ncbi:MAG: hypothetical protein AB8G05_11400 [Oligoflexales bacterium]
MNTLTILLLHGILSFLWSLHLIKKYTAVKDVSKFSLQSVNMPSLDGINPPLTSLFAAPLSLLLVYKFTNYNLMVLPSDSFIDKLTQIAAFSLILFICSGMPHSIKKNAKQFAKESIFCNFYKSSIALGLPAQHTIHKFILIRTMACSYLECLGILFCELFILEPIMNFHGLASKIWISYEKLKWGDFFIYILGFLSCFHIFMASIKIADHWLKQRLEGYDV